MSIAALHILSPGAFASVQDLGRPGLRSQGVPASGALHPQGLQAANVLADQPPGAPAIELIGGGLVAEARGAPLRLAVAGPCTVEVLAEGQPPRRLAPWRSFTLYLGQRLRLAAPATGRVAYLALAGLTLPTVLGSSSACLRAGFGGHAPDEGRPLRAGDALPARAADARASLLALAAPPEAMEWDAGAAPIRAVPGPQADHFSPEQQAAFWAATWTLTRDADRMGLRLAGPALSHRRDDPHKGAEIVTDATVPGAIQVPGHGQPIVLLADGHTAGGYPKIATVCSADLPRLAVAAPGACLCFAPVTAAAALALTRETAQRWQTRLADLHPLPPMPPDAPAVDEAALYAGNLISGVVNARQP